MSEPSIDLFTQQAQVDIALTIGALIAKAAIDIGDSRELVSNVLQWAAEFTDRYKDDIEDEKIDYLLEVDQYAVNRFAETYEIEPAS